MFSLSLSIAALCISAVVFSLNPSFQLFFIGFGSVFIGTVLAVRLKWLSTEAGFSAFSFGILTVFSGGFESLVFAALFLVSGSLSSKNENSGKGRRAIQIWANAGTFAFLMSVFAFSGQHEFLVASLASLTCAAADTMASGIGERSRKKTISILTLKSVPPGTDGGISFPGTVAAFATAGTMALAGLPLFTINLKEALAIGAVGFFGSVADSYLGALFQNRGNRFSVSNDGVNALATTGSAAVMWIVFNYGMV